MARELRRRFAGDHGFSLWQDLADMEGGKDWWRQITAAVDQVEYVVLVMTAGALALPWCATSGATRDSEAGASFW